MPEILTGISTIVSLSAVSDFAECIESFARRVYMIIAPLYYAACGVMPNALSKRHIIILPWKVVREELYY